jgi:ribosomal-protein-alanine N-acetyltransferase
MHALAVWVTPSNLRDSVEEAAFYLTGSSGGARHRPVAHSTVDPCLQLTRTLSSRPKVCRKKRSVSWCHGTIGSAPIRIRPISVADTNAIMGWRYDAPYNTYEVNELISADAGYWAVVRRDELIGYCCFGREGRVEGVAEEPGTIDVGYGMRPDLTGHGLGPSFVGRIVAFAQDEFMPERLRLLILDWNVRSRRVAEALGFQHSETVRNSAGAFLVMVRDTRASSAATFG